MEEARAEAAAFVAMGGVLLPIVPLESSSKRGRSRVQAADQTDMDVDVDEVEDEDEDEDENEDEEVGDSFDVAFHPKHPNRKVSKRVATKSKAKKTNVEIEAVEEIEYADVEVDATSGVALAGFLKTRPKEYLVEMQKELLVCFHISTFFLFPFTDISQENDPRAFNILNEAFKRVSLGPEPHSNIHAPQDVMYNPTRRKVHGPPISHCPKKTQITSPVSAKKQRHAK